MEGGVSGGSSTWFPETVSSSLHLPGDFLLFAERLLVMIWESICGDLENKLQKE